MSVTSLKTIEKILTKNKDTYFVNLTMTLLYLASIMFDELKLIYSYLSSNIKADALLASKARAQEYYNKIITIEDAEQREKKFKELQYEFSAMLTAEDIASVLTNGFRCTLSSSRLTDNRQLLMKYIGAACYLEKLESIADVKATETLRSVRNVKDILNWSDRQRLINAYDFCDKMARLHTQKLVDEFVELPLTELDRISTHPIALTVFAQ